MAYIYIRPSRRWFPAARQSVPNTERPVDARQHLPPSKDKTRQDTVQEQPATSRTSVRTPSPDTEKEKKITPPAMTMTMTTTMMVVMVMMMMMGLVTAQPPWPAPPTASCIEILTNKTSLILAQSGHKLDRMYSVYCVDNFPGWHQLWVTDEEAERACEAVDAVSSVKRSVALAPHPRSCFAYLRCWGVMLDSLTVNTIYRFSVGVSVVSDGSYFDPQINMADSPTFPHWGVINNCAADPCKTGRAMPEARQCNKYYTCKRDAANNAVGYDVNYCSANQSYSYTLDRCVSDNTCNPSAPSTTENVRCYKAPPTGVMIPGLTEQSYYNRTYRFLTSNEEVTVQQVCAAGLIFDPTDTRCTEECLCVIAPIEPCTTTTLINAGAGTGRSWTQEISKSQYIYEVETQGQFLDWVKFFPDREFSYYEALGLEQTELSGNWNLTFSVAEDNGNPGDYELCQNSDSGSACPNPSFRIRVVGRTVRADITLKDGRPVSVSVNDVFLNLQPRQKATILLRREGDNLTLKVTGPTIGQLEQTVGGMGSGPLASTRCGLVFGNHFRGWLESVNMIVKQCTE